MLCWLTLAVLVSASSGAPFTFVCCRLWEWDPQNPSSAYTSPPSRMCHCDGWVKNWHFQRCETLTVSCRESLSWSAKSMSFLLELKAFYFKLQVEKEKIVSGVYSLGWESSPKRWVQTLSKRGAVWSLACHIPGTFLLPLSRPLIPWGFALEWAPEHPRAAGTC